MTEYNSDELKDRPDFGLVKIMVDYLVLPGSYLIFPFHNSHPKFQEFFNFNGGDEDFLVLFKGEPNLSFTDYFGSGCMRDCDRYDLGEGMGAYVYTHS